MNDGYEIPQLYKRHVFACYTQRPAGHPRGSCGALGAPPLWEHLGKKLEAEGLNDVGFTPAGCFGFCQTGPLMVVYPEGIWYRPETVADIDEIVDRHLKEGMRADRLAMVLER